MLRVIRGMFILVSLLGSFAAYGETMLKSNTLVLTLHQPDGRNVNGQILPIAQNQALFSLFGTMYGGDGRTSFALPDMRGRSPVHVGQAPGLSNIVQGQKAGAETTQLTAANMPSHSHEVAANSKEVIIQSTGIKLVDSKEYQYTLHKKLTDRQKNKGKTGIDLEIDKQDEIIDLSEEAKETPEVGNGSAVQIRNLYLGLRCIVAIQGTFPARP